MCTSSVKSTCSILRSTTTLCSVSHSSDPLGLGVTTLMMNSSGTDSLQGPVPLQCESRGCSTSTNCSPRTTAAHMIQSPRPRSLWTRRSRSRISCELCLALQTPRCGNTARAHTLTHTHTHTHTHTNTHTRAHTHTHTHKSYTCIGVLRSTSTFLSRHATHILSTVDPQTHCFTGTRHFCSTRVPL
jgi:hypothetical protein